jgi:hypothetical protein
MVAAKDFAVLADCSPRPARDWGNLALSRNGKSPAQVLDQAVQSLPFLFFDARHPPERARAFDVAAGFRNSDRLMVSVDPVVDKAAVLGEQTKKVVGLELVRHLSRSSTAIDITGGRVRGQRRRGAALTGIR